MSTRLCFTDCESSGLHPEQGHELWELAVIVREPHMPDVEYVWQIRPDLNLADPESLEISRFHERFIVPDGWDAVQIYEDGSQEKGQIARALYGIQDVLQDAYLVGAVPSFDDAMLKALVRRYDRPVLWRHRLICVETLVAGALRHPVPQGLRKAAEAVGVKVDDDARHTALGDARLARDVYDAVMGGAR